MSINPLTGQPFNWMLGDMNYGDLSAMLSQEQQNRAIFDQWSGAAGDANPGIGVYANFADPTYAAMQQYGSTPGAQIVTQEDGRMWRDAILGQDGNVLWGGDPYYHSPDSPWKDAILPMAAFAIAAPMLGNLAGIPTPAGTPTLGGLLGSGGAAAEASAAGAEAGGTLADMTLNGLQPFSMADAGLAGAAGAGAASAGGSLLDAAKTAGGSAMSFLKDNKWALPLIGAGLGTAAGSSSGGGYVDSGYRPMITRSGWKPQVSATLSQPQQGLLNLPTTGNDNSGLWRFLKGN